MICLHLEGVPEMWVEKLHLKVRRVRHMLMLNVTVFGNFCVVYFISGGGMHLTNGCHDDVGWSTSWWDAKGTPECCFSLGFPSTIFWHHLYHPVIIFFIFLYEVSANFCG
jgi:hypothetical protein